MWTGNKINVKMLTELLTNRNFNIFKDNSENCYSVSEFIANGFMHLRLDVKKLRIHCSAKIQVSEQAERESELLFFTRENIHFFKPPTFCEKA